MKELSTVRKKLLIFLTLTNINNEQLHDKMKELQFLSGK